MHFEILVEDESGKKFLEILIPQLIGESNTYKIISYKGIGHIPSGLSSKVDPRHRILLDRLPKLISGYGKTFSSYHPSFQAVVIVVCDLDKKNLSDFLGELKSIVDKCDSKPNTRFCIAIEEGEAWYLGDVEAIRLAYPKMKNDVIDSYVQDSICGTWEKLADAIYKGGANALKKNNQVGKIKYEWAEKITPLMNVERNESLSFKYFVHTIKELKSE